MTQPPRQNTLPGGNTGLRPTRPELPSFRAEWHYAEVFRILLDHKTSIHSDFLHPELFSQGREIF